MNYREMLVEASRRYKELEVPAPLSWLDHKNAQNLKAWREKVARVAKGE